MPKEGTFGPVERQEPLWGSLLHESLYGLTQKASQEMCSVGDVSLLPGWTGAPYMGESPCRVDIFKVHSA